MMVLQSDTREKEENYQIDAMMVLIHISKRRYKVSWFDGIDRYHSIVVDNN